MHMYPGIINCCTEHNYFRVLAAFILKNKSNQIQRQKRAAKPMSLRLWTKVWKHNAKNIVHIYHPQTQSYNWEDTLTSKETYQ